jgi:hypothetical protein
MESNQMLTHTDHTGVANVMIKPQGIAGIISSVAIE